MEEYSSQQSLAIRLSGEHITEMVEWLDNRALCTLILCGDKVLNGKFAKHVRAVRHESNIVALNYKTEADAKKEGIRRFTWPFYIHGWTALKQLSVRPGRSLYFENQHASPEWLALTERVLASLPRSLEELHLNDWPLWLKDAFSIVWRRHVEQMEIEPMQLLTSGITPSEAPISHISGAIAMLHRFYLPNLQRFSASASHGSNIDMFEEIFDIGGWINGARHVPLTHLSLSNVVLSNLNGTLCEVLSVLPRTLTKLGLDVKNTNHCDALNADVFTRTWTPDESDEFERRESQAALVLPPHLTYLKLHFQVSSYMPAALLANLSQLRTLKLGVRVRHVYSRRALHLLAHLPLSVCALSLAGYTADDLQLGLKAIPEEAYCELRHLIVKRALVYDFSTPGSVQHMDWISTVLTSPKFRRLETFCPYTIYRYYIVNNPQEELVVGEMLESMVHLRSISEELLSAILAHVRSKERWAITSHLTPTMPLNVLRSKRPNAKDDFFVNFDDSAWYKSVAIHFTTKRLHLSESTWQILDIFYNPSSYHHLRDYCAPHAASSAETLFKSVKHVTMPAHKKYFPALRWWPHALKSLTIRRRDTWSVELPSTTIDWTLPNVRTLRALTVETKMLIPNLDRWMRSLPETLEKLTAKYIEITDEKYNDDYLPSERPLDDDNRLTYMPPRLKRLQLHGSFFVDSATFDAVPPSLREIRWIDMAGVRGGSSDLHRLPKDIRQLQLGVRMSQYATEYEHCHDEVMRWRQSAKYLESVNIQYRTRTGQFYQYNNNP